MSPFHDEFIESTKLAEKAKRHKQKSVEEKAILPDQLNPRWSSTSCFEIARPSPVKSFYPKQSKPGSRSNLVSRLELRPF